MMGAKTNAADCPEYAEVDHTGRYGRVRYRYRRCSSSYHRPFLDSFPYQSADPFACSSALCSQFNDVLGKGASKTV